MKFEFVDLSVFNAAKASKENATTARAKSGKREEIRQFLMNPDNIGKPITVPNEWLICAKAPEGFTKDSTEEQINKIKHGFINSTVMGLNREEFGKKLRYQVVFDKANGKCLFLLESNGKESATEISRTTPEETAATNEAAEEVVVPSA